MDKNLWHWAVLRFIERNHEKHGQIIIGVGQMLRATKTTSSTWT